MLRFSKSIIGSFVGSLDEQPLIQNHKLRHGQRPFKCDFCQKSFFKKYELTDHMDIVHKGLMEHQWLKLSRILEPNRKTNIQ